MNNTTLTIENYIKTCNSKLDNIYVRKLVKEDYKEYIHLLSQLTEVGNITYEIFINRLEEIKKNIYLHIYVICNKNTNKLIGTGTLYVEPKIIHNCSNVGHIEDIVINKEYRGKKYGNYIIKLLVDLANIVKCYKVILDCKEHNIKFYEKCNFIKEGYEMRYKL